MSKKKISWTEINISDDWIIKIKKCDYQQIKNKINESFKIHIKHC